MLQIMRKKDVEKLINRTLFITHQFLISQNKVIDSNLKNFDNYVKELNKFQKEKNL